MSLDEASLAPGRRFGADLRKIREEKGVSVEVVRESTKAPKGLIEQFEQTALLDHEMFNRVYLRSFVRSYAEALGLPVDDVLAALEEVFEGSYAGRLAATYLREEAPASREEEEPPEAAASELKSSGPEGLSEPEASLPEDISEPEGSVPEEDTAREAVDGKTVSPEAKAVSGGEGPGRASSEEKRAVEGSLRRSGAARAVRTGRGPYARRAGALRGEAALGGGTPWRIVVGAGVILVVVIAVLWFTTRPAPAPVETPPPAPDTTAAEAPPAPAPLVLGDTMTVYVVAARGPLQRLRVQVDDDLRRPYWIEEGDSMRFRPVERIIFQNPRALRRARITLEGFPYPVSPEDTLIVLTRADARAFLDSLSRTLPASTEPRL